MPSARNLLFLLLVTGTLAACAPLARTTVGPRVDDAVGEALLAGWRASSETTFSIQGIANATVRTPEQKISGTQVLLAERPGHFRVESLSPFGTPLLTLTANSERLGVLVPGQNLFFSGTANAQNLGRFTRMPLDPAALVDLLLYRVPLVAPRSRETRQLADGGWQVTLEGAGRRQELYFNAERQLADVRYFLRDELFLKVAYNRFGAFAEGAPARIDIELPEFETTARLDFSEMTLNRTFLPGIFNLEPPEGVEVRSLDAE